MMGFGVLTFEAEVGFTQKRVNPKISLQNYYFAVVVKKDKLKESKMFLLFYMVSKSQKYQHTTL